MGVVDRFALGAVQRLRPSVGPFFWWQRCVLVGIVNVPEIDDEAIFGLDLEHLHIETNPPGIVGGIAHNWVVAALGGYEVVAFRVAAFLPSSHTQS